MDFQNEKKMLPYRIDKSHEQQVDKAILSLCKKINNKKEYYTTSSCAGRMVLIKGLPEKAKNVFLFKSHEKISFSQIKTELIKIKYKKLIYFKQEPCILHVACSSLEPAQILLNKALQAGWKRSGIIASKKRIILELISTEKLELPLMNKGKTLVNDKFFKILMKEANKRLEKSRAKIQKLEKLL